MFQANVYKVMIGAPSDVESEVNVVREVIHKWNYINAASHNLVLLPSHWSIDTYPTLSHKPQKAIDKQLVDKSDMLICIFGSKIGTPTNDYISGTVEEIEEHRKDNRPVMVFFSKSIDKSKTTPEQIGKLLSFQQEMYNLGLCAEFQDKDDLRKILTDKLALCVNDNFFGYGEHNHNMNNVLSPINISTLKQTDIDALKEWVESGREYAYLIDFLGGSSLIVLGRKQIAVKNAREKVKWNGFFERLLNIGFIEIYRYAKNSNKPEYRLKEAAYNFVDSL